VNYLCDARVCDLKDRGNCALYQCPVSAVSDVGENVDDWRVNIGMENVRRVVRMRVISILAYCVGKTSYDMGEPWQHALPVRRLV